jgi:methyltransferase-like protein/SAM-dependent methyltransferase
MGGAYDRVPYQSRPYPLSHPRHLAVIGKTFGLSPALPEKSRILDLGCASGGNLIPVAAAYPDCTCVGIDLSSRQIDAGKADIAALGLTNIQLEQGSIADIGPDLGLFDYIICHGVFSWVPVDIQKQILRVCRENLAPRGLAYVSYNTLPGWNQVRSVRDMMLYHTAQFADPAVKVDEAMKMLHFAAEALPNDNSSWRQVIEKERDALQHLDGSYLYHEHLEEENNPVYFHHFMDLAQDCGLQYVGDSLLPTMYVGALPQATAETLQQLTDIVRQEQYIDFVRNRRFRMTVLTHQDEVVSRKISAERILDLYLTAPGLSPDFIVGEQNWALDIPRGFGNGTVTANNRYSAMLLTILHEQGNTPIAARDLLARAGERLQLSDLSALTTQWGAFSLHLCFLGHITLHDGPYLDVATLSDRPVAWPLARYQATQGDLVTNLRHQTVRLDKAGSLLIQLLDGSRDFDSLAEDYQVMLTQEGAHFHVNGSATTNPDQIRAIAQEQVQIGLQILFGNSLLIG